jgi:hypothetical protein
MTPESIDYPEEEKSHHIKITYRFIKDLSAKGKTTKNVEK